MGNQLTFISSLSPPGPGPECDRGGDPHDVGNHQLLSVQLITPQPQPGLRTALQEGAFRAVQDAPVLSRHHAEPGHGLSQSVFFSFYL